jgi:ceramidase
VTSSAPRRLLIAVVSVAAIAAAFWLDRIPQDPGYHVFADRNTLFGIPNFWNVATNLPFLFVGLAGFTRRSRLKEQALHTQYAVFCIGAALVGLGSAYYHWAPSTPTLVWDRLPMTVAFMALFSAVIQDRVSESLGRVLLWPLVIAGFATIAWWYWSELAGRGDLRPYAVVQFLPMLLIPLVLLLFSGRGLRDGWLWSSLAAYALAKVAEYFDAAIYGFAGFLSGHSIKHLLGAIAVWLAIRAFTDGAGLSDSQRLRIRKPGTY